MVGAFQLGGPPAQFGAGAWTALRTC